MVCQKDKEVGVVDDGVGRGWLFLLCKLPEWREVRFSLVGWASEEMPREEKKHKGARSQMGKRRWSISECRQQRRQRRTKWPKAPWVRTVLMGLWPRLVSRSNERVDTVAQDDGVQRESVVVFRSETRCSWVVATRKMSRFRGELGGLVWRGV